MSDFCGNDVDILEKCLVTPQIPNTFRYLQDASTFDTLHRCTPIVGAVSRGNRREKRRQRMPQFHRRARLITVLPTIGNKKSSLMMQQRNGVFGLCTFLWARRAARAAESKRLCVYVRLCQSCGSIH